MSVRTEHELAGGIEDWEDIEVEDVNRYGFIESRRKSDRPGTAEPRPVQRVSTVLELASSAPRKKRTFGRAASSTASTKKGAGQTARSVSQNSNSSQRSNGRIRSVSNRLPGNRDRRFVDEAGDMLTLPPGLADVAEEEEGGKASKALKRKEIERGEKWQKMAKIIKKGEDGKGMEFEFDPKNPKVIERTWKGIPDRWRGAVWYSFLAASAKKREDTVPDVDIIKFFHKLQDQSSADDVQIDLDVPRTISQHIMFRKRYRGGQRLLFRVLHAVSLYFPDTGYVQGMASLAATLLCYYDEERAFVMLVRMFTLRSLGKLYESGFGGLIAALEEFKVKWLAAGEVSKKLDELNIEPTSWGTRWYLTLFNLSIPFAAQLRVWDVFMLLGDIDPLLPSTPEQPFQGGLDVLHAASAALIAATREILMDSDFENAMKVLTSFVPIKDEELLMKVTRAEWKVHRGKHRV
ncbi:RabGAP/TBC [Acephala macrosclerotiorum]|nr:RabGAP/TBC [Acephala macrosclerotiorum]